MSIGAIAIVLGMCQAPPSVEMMKANRSSVVTADISWSLTDHRQKTTAQYRFRRGANGDTLSSREMSPEDEENFAFPEQGKPPPPTAVLLDEDGSVWLRRMPTLFLEHFASSQDAMMAVEFRSPLSVGHDHRLVELPNASSVFESILRYGSEEALPDGRIRVAGYFSNQPSNEGSIEWTIDPGKDWNAERIVSRDSEGHVVGSIEFQLEKIDDVWYPRQATAYQGERREPTLTFHCLPNSRFNIDANPLDLTPAHLGADAGFLVKDFFKGISSAWTDVWDGERMVSSAEWSAALAAGQKRRGPEAERVHSESARIVALQKSSVRKSDVPLLPDCWDEYVASFCKAYRLEESQIRKADDLLTECKRRAVRIADKDPSMRSELGSLREQRGKNPQWYRMARSFVVNNAERLNSPVKNSGNENVAIAPPSATLVLPSDLHRRTRRCDRYGVFQRTVKPVREIFEKELQPRLFELPTTRQIAESNDPEGLARKSDGKPGSR